MQEKPSDISIEQVFEKFLKIKECSNVAPDTISYYQRCFKSFKRFYDTSLPCNSITLDTINDYVIFLKENTKDNDITINSHLRGIRAFLSQYVPQNNLYDVTVYFLLVVRHREFILHR